MSLPQLDHIAVAVKSLEQGQAIYRDLGLVFEEERERVESQGVETSFAPIGEGAKLELLSPIGENGPIHKFLEKYGPGIHHICFRVADVRETTRRLSKQGRSLIYPEPIEGAQNCLVNFIHPSSTGGVLIEISTPLEDIKG